MNCNGLRNGIENMELADMSIKERAKKYQKKDEPLEKQKEDKVVEQPLETPQETLKEPPQETLKEPSQVTKITPEILFEQQIPSWVNKPWMYIKPSNPAQLNSWIEGWKTLLLDYCRIFVKHIVNLIELQREHPFRNRKNGKALTLPQLTAIIDSMVDEGIAKWLDENKILARIYYKPIDQWADEIYQYLLDTGKAAEVLTFLEFKNMDTDWSSLPDEDLKEILRKFVAEGKAQFVSKEEDAIEFIF
ncbi:MAG: hypothetical protein D6732_21565 [Methanobacteriota archaeon]|nr:MAG: hypothetical protein D6732_21565 [Euryarchaeota archaeon]